MNPPHQLPKLSVLICAHNPRQDYLGRVLEALRLQTLSLDQWELLLIDNGSTLPLAKICEPSWHPDARHIREDKLGLTLARLRGIQESTSDLLVFVDDDNVLESHYLENALNLATEWPKIGAFGGSQFPEYEEIPETDIERHTYMLAIRTVSELLWTNIKGTDDATPRGAGMCIRRNLALAYARQVEITPLRKMLGRSGPNGLLSGEDTDMAWSVCDAGYGMLLSPALSLTHLIDKKRLNKDYLLKIAQGHAASGVLLAYLHNLPNSKSPWIEYAREGLRILQARGPLDKKLLISGIRGRQRGYGILKEMGARPSRPVLNL